MNPSSTFYDLFSSITTPVCFVSAATASPVVFLVNVVQLGVAR